MSVIHSRGTDNWKYLLNLKRVQYPEIIKAYWIPGTLFSGASLSAALCISRSHRLFHPGSPMAPRWPYRLLVPMSSFSSCPWSGTFSSHCPGIGRLSGMLRASSLRYPIFLYSILWGLLPWWPRHRCLPASCHPDYVVYTVFHLQYYNAIILYKVIINYFKYKCLK